MPDVEPLRFPSREGRPSRQDQADLQTVCSGRRRTCALLNSPSPCVNSAIYHIQEMKMTVENWCQQSGRYHSNIDQDKKHYSKTRKSKDSDSDSVVSTDLFVEGIAISARESCPSSPLLKKVNEVLTEVVYLIERLEADRQSAEEGLQKEKQRKRLLESKVDSIALWKQNEHAYVVQKEHEACIRDITELKFQLKMEREKLEQVQQKFSRTEVLNQHLKGDISFAKKQIPIVRENLEHQKSITIPIKNAHAKAGELCSKTQSELLLAQRQLNEMKLRANKEKMSSDDVLLAMKNQLAEKLENLKKLGTLEKSLLSAIHDAEDTFALTEKKCELINQQMPELMELEKAEKDRISEMNLEIEAEMQKNINFKETLNLLLEDIEKTKINGEAEVFCLEEQLRSKSEVFAALRKENMEYEESVEDYKMKVIKSEELVKQMREEMKQMLQEINDNDERWGKAKEEVTKVVAEHGVIQARLEEEEQLTFIEEQRARIEIENLKKDLTVEMTALEVVKDQCANVNKELEQHQNSSEKTNQQLRKEFEAASSALKALGDKVQKKKELTEDWEKMQCEHKKILMSLEEEKKLKCDQLKAAQDLHSATIERYNTTVGNIKDRIGKTEEYQEASDKMEKSIENLPEVIAELQRDLNVLEFKNKSAALIMSTLQSDINNCQQRTQRSMQTHTALVTARKKQMEDTKEALKTALEENKQLARKYEDLQNILIESKQEAASALSERNRAHESFHSNTQLSLLEKRMHKALEKYFKQRNLYNQAELGRCQALSQETDQKIKTAQERLSEELQLISGFLKSLQDDSTTVDDAEPPNLLHGTVASCGPCTTPGLRHSPGPHSPDSPS
ncbi:unnamed protein product, partial [Menidia menidia]